MQQTSLMRVLFVLSVLWGASIFWVAPRPPMIDLPQHAGQVALLKDLLLGQSQWADLVRINLLTPYLIGYGLALPLSFVLPIEAALKMLLSIAYICFVCMCVVLRRHFRADPRLDWLFLPSFFGFAYGWGFLTFLVAAPIGLGFILLADRYACHRTPARAALVTMAGLVLLMSHGLTFSFAWLVGVGLIAVRVQPVRKWPGVMVPFILLALACVIYFVISRYNEAGIPTSVDTKFLLGWDQHRLAKILVYAVTYAAATHWTAWVLVASLLLPLAPWLMGLRIDPTRRAACMAFAVVALIMLVVPSFALKTAFLFERFALFLLPTYAWMFAHSVEQSGNPMRPGTRAWIAMLMLPALCWSLLSLHTLRAWRFAEEAADFEAILAEVEPGHRALSLVFNRESSASQNNHVYLHHAAWYQAKKKGFVDFNFAWFTPQVARFRPDRIPPVGLEFEWMPETFDWQKHRGDDYHYFFVRHTQRLPEGLFSQAVCPPTRVLSKGTWTVFVRRVCG